MDHLLTYMRNLVATFAVFAASVAPLCAQYTLSFSSTGKATVSFDGSGGFAFLPQPEGVHFSVVTASNDLLDGVTGRIDSVFTIGTRTGGNPDSATVTSSATISLIDAVGTSIVGTLTGGQVRTTTGSGFTFGDFQPLTFEWGTYTGSNAQLEAFEGKTSSLGVGFFSLHHYPLSVLAATPASFPFSGELVVTNATVIPEPATYALALGAMALGMVLWRRRQRR